MNVVILKEKVAHNTGDYFSESKGITRMYTFRSNNRESEVNSYNHYLFYPSLLLNGFFILVVFFFSHNTVGLNYI